MNERCETLRNTISADDTIERDTIYYKFLPKIDAWVWKWCRSDDSLRCNHHEIRDDAHSYAYLYWMKLLKRFEGDMTQVEPYYVRTVTLKLDTYLNSFWKGQWHRGYVENGVPGYKRLAPLINSLDAVDDSGRTLADTAGNRGLGQLLHYDEYFQDEYKQYVQQFIDEAPPQHRVMVQKMVDNALQYSDAHPSSSLERGANAYGLTDVAEEVGRKPLACRNAWFTFRSRFVKRHPEIREALQGKEAVN